MHTGIRWSLSVGLSLSAFAGSEPAHACGGLFCDTGAVTFPVAQAGEGIVFAVDRTEQTVRAIISVQYQGEASDFAWVLPLQSAPLDLDVVPAQTFATIDALTQPQFRLSYEEEGICTSDIDVSFGANAPDDALARIDDPGQGGVQVLGQEAVGPYDSVVIQSSDPGDLRTWLGQNGYVVTDEMMDAVTPYVANGDALLALKLQKDNDVGDIQPIAVTMSGDEVCVPIRLTAIAALEDMEITTLVLSNEGRAIPENYNHVTLNLAKIDWLRAGSNYRQVVAQAADEGSGNAFTTEFAGDAMIFRAAFYTSGKYDRTAIESTTTINGFVSALQLQNLLVHREIIGILLRHLPDSAFIAAGTTKAQFRANPQSASGAFPNDPFDPTAATQEIWERIVDREKAVQELFDRYRYATRLYTLISPEEMTLDPTFVFDRALPGVDNVHRAKLIRDCGVGGQPGSSKQRIEIEETGHVIELGTGEVDRRVLDGMPAASKIEQLNEGRLIQDNASLIAELVEQHNDEVSGCGCSAARSPTGTWWAGIVLLAAALLRRKLGRQDRS